MSKNTKIVIGILIVLVVVFGLVYFSKNNGNLNENVSPIGGQKDEHGCLNPAGYAYSEDVGACIRAFEMTPDIMRAAKIAVDSVGKSYALTVVSFNSYEEPGAYDIMFERGVDRTKQTVYIKNWQAQK
jgi:hypothetical protein